MAEIWKPKPPTCDGCPARDVGKSYVPGHGPPAATKALVGSSITEQDALEQSPFGGPLGNMLTGWLAKAGFPTSEWYLDSVVRCCLPRPPTSAELRHCMTAHLIPALESRPLVTVIVPVGELATEAFIGTSGETVTGALFDIDFQKLPGVQSTND
jgi:uracil-DNA glycosylase family 4